MIYSVEGKLAAKTDRFVVVEAGGLGLKLFMRAKSVAALPTAGSSVKIFSYLNVKEDGMDLYGFILEEERFYFELLISVSGVGPKSALSILDVASLDELSAAIKEGRPDFLPALRASGRRRRNASSSSFALRSQSAGSGRVIERMEMDTDLVEALAGLGYRREEARAALGKVDVKVAGVEERLKEALKILGKR